MTEYSVHIKQFEGPLDLLLFLIEKAEVDIQDVFISEITSEFLEYVRRLETPDMDQVSDFLTIAATLIYMKSKALFPPEAKDTDDEADLGAQLILQLQEYKRFKEAAFEMRQCAENAQYMRSKLPEEFPLPQREIVLKDTTVQALYEAILRALAKTGEPAKQQSIHEVMADTYTVRTCARKLRTAIENANGSVCFSDIARDATKMELVVTFMALLEMLSRGEIRIEQTVAFGEIYIHAVKLLFDDEESDYMDEVE